LLECLKDQIGLLILKTFPIKSLDNLSRGQKGALCTESKTIHP